MAELKEKIGLDGGRRTSDLGKEVAVMRSMTSVAVHEDLQYNSLVLRNCKLLTEKNKVDRKMKAQALLNNIKHILLGREELHTG